MKRRWQVVSLDVGGTLIEPWPSVGQVYAGCAASVGFGPVDPAALNRRFAEEWKAAQIRGFDYSLEAWGRIVADSFRGLVADPGSKALFAEAYERFAWPGAWRIFDDVRPLLRALSDDGIKLVVTSNWDERLKPLLTRLRLAGNFDFVAVSGEIGYHKPDVRLFQAVTRHLGVSPQAILHVGDSDFEDVAGARAAGWEAWRLNRRGSTDGAARTAGTLYDVARWVLDSTTAPWDMAVGGSG